MSASGIAMTAALGLFVLGAGGWAMWNSTASAHRTTFNREIMVDVVAPREPERAFAGVMTVGDLNDAYVHDPAKLRAETEFPGRWIETAWLAPEETTYPSAAAHSAQAPTQEVPAPEMRAHDYRFGFDEPHPDYAAERAERRRRIEQAAASRLPSAYGGADSLFY